jgi:hypothetical protein
MLTVPSHPLGPRSVGALGFVLRHHAEHGRVPSGLQIEASCKMGPPNGMQVLQSLVVHGYLRIKGRHRWGRSHRYEFELTRKAA